MKQTSRWLLLAMGGAAGLVNGFFGSAGGAVLVVFLGLWASLPQKQIFATTVSVTCLLSVVSALVYQSRTDLDWAMALPFLLGGALGGIAGGIWFQNLPLPFLKKLFALLLIFVGAKGVLGL